MELTQRTDRDWEQWGKENPYFGVITLPKYLRENLTEDSFEEFFATGERHVERVYSVIRASVQPAFQPVRVLDYGCGVGRLIVPFAKRSQAVFGIDVSPSMLEQARKNCDKFDVPWARLERVDKLDSLKLASFDLVHSYIVLQHIPVARGERILRKLISLIAEGGVGALHFSYYADRSAFKRCVLALRQKNYLVNGLVNLAQRRPFTQAHMQMNCYSLNNIFEILIEEHCSNLHIEFSDHSGIHGAMLYFEKPVRPLL
jgi:SAM-dependent methyltransferase